MNYNTSVCTQFHQIRPQAGEKNMQSHAFICKATLSSTSAENFLQNMWSTCNRLFCSYSVEICTSFPLTTTKVFSLYHCFLVSKKHGKLITFLRTFMKSRPTKQKLKQRGILKERVFGCDLGEHLLNSGFEGKHEIYNLIISVSNFSLLISFNQLDMASSTCSIWDQQDIPNALRCSPDFGVTENHEGSRNELWH